MPDTKSWSRREFVAWSLTGSAALSALVPFRLSSSRDDARRNDRKNVSPVQPGPSIAEIMKRYGAEFGNLEATRIIHTGAAR